MNIVLARIDDRLIHGQVAVGWSKVVNPTRIIVVNDKVANDETQKFLLKMAAPSGVEVSFFTIQEAKEVLTSQQFDKEKILLLVRNPIDILELVKGGLNLDKINVGNVRYEENKKTIVKGVAANEEELKAWKELDSLGIRLEAQWLPDKKKVILNKFL